MQTDIYNRLAIGHVVGGPWAAALEPFAHRRVLLVRCDKPGGTRIREGETQVRNAGEPRLRRLAARARGPARRRRGRRPPVPDAHRGRGRGAPTRRTPGSGGTSRSARRCSTITKPDARCAITTQDPDTGERDLDTLRTILRYRGFRADDPERKIDFGVLGEVRRPGRISVGDEVDGPRAGGVDHRRRRGARAVLMADRLAALAGLRPAERQRLERFALAFERLDASSYPLFSEQVVSDDVFAAQEHALELLGSGARKSAVRAAIDAFVDAGDSGLLRPDEPDRHLPALPVAARSRRGPGQVPDDGGARRGRADPVGRARRRTIGPRCSDRGAPTSTESKGTTPSPRASPRASRTRSGDRGTASRRRPPARGRRSPATSRARAAPARRPG